MKIRRAIILCTILVFSCTTAQQAEQDVENRSMGLAEFNQARDYI